MDIDPLRPDWDGFIGQQKLKRRLDVHITAAVNDERTLDPVFLAGPPGFGKTSLAVIIAERLGVPLTTVKMPVTERALISALRAFRGPGVFFMDEIHALPKGLQEMLLPVVDRSTVVNKRGWEFALEGIMLVAATTERDKVIKPLYDRFPIKPEFGEYSDDEMNRIVTGMAHRAGVKLPKPVMSSLGRAAGGVPRNAEQLVFAARDLRASGTDPTLAEILTLVEIDQDGLNATHVRYLRSLAEGGGMMGQKTLEMLLRTSPAVLRETERLLISRKYIEYTPSGREITPEGVRRLDAGMELSA